MLLPCQDKIPTEAQKFIRYFIFFNYSFFSASIRNHLFSDFRVVLAIFIIITMYSVNLFIYNDLRSGDLFLFIVHHTQHITSPTTMHSALDRWVHSGWYGHRPKHSALAVKNTTLICVLNRREEKKKVKGGKEKKKNIGTKSSFSIDAWIRPLNNYFQ